MVTVFNVSDALDALGIAYDTRGEEANALCPLHEQITGREDRNPSWWINLSTGMHICFSCHYKGNILQLVCDVHQFYKTFANGMSTYDYEAAKNWLSNAAEVPVEVLLERLREIPDYFAAPPQLIAMSESRLAIYDLPPEHALLSRNISLESAQAYGVLWDFKNERWILPLREPDDSSLMGWQEKGYVGHYFRNRPIGLPKSTTLFGVNVQREDVVYVVESPLDCLRLHTAGFPGAVAICGSSPSEHQLKLLRGSSKIISMLDNPAFDAAGLKGSKEMLNFARKYGLNLFFFNYGSSSAKDPGEMTDKEISEGISNAISAIYGEQAYVQGDSKTLSS